MRCCKVIATYFGDRKERIDPERIAYPAHLQEGMKDEDVLDMLKKVISAEPKAGVPLDIIIINNQPDYEPGVKWLETLNRTKSPSGNFITFTRPNIGGSYGAYNFAFEHTNYDYYIFTEDDYMVIGKDYAKRAIEKFESLKRCGFLAFLGVSNHSWGIHCHGGVGLSSKEVLDEVYKFNNGGLPNSGDAWNYDNIIKGGGSRAN